MSSFTAPVGNSPFDGDKMIQKLAMEKLQGRDFTNYNLLSLLTGVGKTRFGSALAPLISRGQLLCVRKPTGRIKPCGAKDTAHRPHVKINPDYQERTCTK